MCGFLVINNKSKNCQSLNDVDFDLLRRRGPDHQNSLVCGNYIFKHYRLEIIGGLEGVQPLESKDFIIMLNGEIYNFKTLAKTYNLKSSSYISDTACFLELLILFGIDRLTEVISLLDGHFAIVIYKKEGKQIFFFRDLMGVKPLFYNRNTNSICSDLHTLSKISKSSINQVFLFETCIFGGLTGERTIYDNICQCEPGRIYYIDNNILNKDLFISNKVNYLSDDIGWEKKIYASIANQSITDCDAFLLVSSGIDSRIIKKIIEISKIPNKIDNFSIASQKLGTRIDDLNTEPDVSRLELFGNLTSTEIINCLLAYGCVPAHHNYFALVEAYKQLKKTKNRNYKVAITGEGADEYFGGYGRYIELAKYESHENSNWINSLKRLDEENWLYLMNTRLKHQDLINMLTGQGALIKNILEGRLNDCSIDEKSGLVAKLARYDQETNLRYGLRKQDVAGMLCGIEVRVPFVSQGIHNYGQKLSIANKRESKILLRGLSKKLNIAPKEKIGFPINLKHLINKLKTDYNYGNRVNKMTGNFNLENANMSTDIKNSLFLASFFYDE